MSVLDKAEQIKTGVDVARKRRQGIRIRNPFEYAKQSIADAYIDLGATTPPEKIAEVTGYSVDDVKRTIYCNPFLRFMKRRLVQRGFTADRQRELQNEIGHAIMEDIYLALQRDRKLPASSSKKIPLKLKLEMWKISEDIALKRYQAEAVQKQTQGEDAKRVESRKESIHRMMNNPRFAKMIDSKRKGLPPSNGDGKDREDQ